MFEWFRVRESKNLGIELARLVQEYELNDRTRAASKRSSKMNYAKEKMRKHILKFKQDETLNFYKMATLLNTFKWELKDAGYDEELTSELASWVHLVLREA